MQEEDIGAPPKPDAMMRMMTGGEASPSQSEAPKTKKRNKAKLGFKLTDISGVDPIGDAIENGSVRYTLSIKAAKDDAPFQELQKKGVVTGVHDSTSHGTTIHTANIDPSLNAAIADSSIKGSRLSLPETIELKNLPNVNIAYQSVSDEVEGEDPVLVIRGRAPDLTKFFKSNNLGATGNLHQCPDSQDSSNPEYIATCRISEPVLEAMQKGTLNKDGSDALLALHSMMEESVEMPEFPDAFALQNFAAEHISSPHQRRKKAAQQPTAVEKETLKTLESYEAALQECEPSLSSQLRIDGSVNQYIEVSAEHKDGFERLRATLCDARKTNPALSIDRSSKKKLREGEPFFRYRIADNQTAELLKGTLGQEFDAPEPYRLPERLFDNKSDFEKGTRWEETIHPITLTKDPEHEDRAFLYIGAMREPFSDNSHSRFKEINRHLGKGKYITRMEGGKSLELPAMQRISVPLHVAEQIFDQLAENETLEEKINIDLWETDGIDSVEVLDETVKEAAGVSSASEKKTIAPTKKTEATPLTEKDTALMRRNYVAGLKEVIEAQEARGITPNIAQAVVKHDDHYRTVIITQMSEEELKAYSEANVTELHGRYHRYHGNIRRGRKAGKNRSETVKYFMLPGIDLHEQDSETEKFFAECESQNIAIKKLNPEKGSGFVDLAEAPSLKEAVDLAMSRFASQTQAESVAREAKPPEERAFDAILSGMYLADEKLPTTNDFLEDKKRIDELKSKKKELQATIDTCEDISAIGCELRDGNSGIPGLPEKADDIHLAAQKAKQALEAVNTKIEALEANVSKEIDFASMQEGRTATTILAIKVNPQQRKDIEDLWKEGGNNEHYLRAPKRFEKTLAGKDMMAIYPSGHMMEKLQKYDQENIRKQVERTPERDQKRTQASLDNAHQNRWQKKSPRPIPSSKLVEAVSEWEGLGPKDPYQQLRIAIDQEQLNTVRDIAHKLSERPETRLSPALSSLLGDACDPEQKGKRPLQLAASALLLHDIAGQGDAEHIIQSRLDNLEPSIRETVTREVNNEKESRIIRALEADDKAIDEATIRAAQEQWAEGEIDKRTAAQVAARKPLLETALTALTEHGTQGIDRNATPMEDALQTITDELKTLKPLLLTEGTPAYDENALEEALDARLGENDFRKYKFEREDETRIGKQHMLIIPVKSAESVDHIQALIWGLSNQAPTALCNRENAITQRTSKRTLACRE